MVDATEAKVVSLLGLFFGTVFFGVFPIKVEQVLIAWRSHEDRESAVRRSRWGDTALSWLLCFGGGVLFATCFIHMIPEVREGFKEAQMDEDSFPWTELIISCGFFLIYLVEEIVHWALCLHSGHAHHASESRTIRSCAANPYEPNRTGADMRGDGGGVGLSCSPAEPVVPKFSLERSVELGKTETSTTIFSTTRFSTPPTTTKSRLATKSKSKSRGSASMTTIADTWTAMERGDEEEEEEVVDGQENYEYDDVTTSFASRSLDSATEYFSQKDTQPFSSAQIKSYGAVANSTPTEVEAWDQKREVSQPRVKFAPVEGGDASARNAGDADGHDHGHGILSTASSLLRGVAAAGAEEGAGACSCTAGACGDQIVGNGQQRSWSLVHEHSISPLRSIFIILALSFHSLFEGLAIGLQKTSTDVWYLFAAVSFHKFVITFCVGLELVVGGVSRLMVFVYILVFALVSPIGVAIGIVLSEGGAMAPDAETLTTTILSGIAAGTLLYVTFFEVLQRERERQGNGIVRLLFIIAGYGAMVSIELLNGHDHGHS